MYLEISSSSVNVSLSLTLTGTISPENFPVLVELIVLSYDDIAKSSYN
jgi:hypothetical protein